MQQCINIFLFHIYVSGPGSSVGIATELRAGRSGDRIPVGARFSAPPDRPWGPPSLLYNGYRVFQGGKVRPGRDAGHSPPSSADVLEQYSYNSTPLWATTGPVRGLLYLLYLYEAEHVSGDTPPIIRSLKLHWQSLVFHTWKVVGRLTGGRCQAHCA